MPESYSVNGRWYLRAKDEERKAIKAQYARDKAASQERLRKKASEGPRKSYSIILKAPEHENA